MIATRNLYDWLAPRASPQLQELQAESIAVSIRWFGLVVGGLLTNIGGAGHSTYLNIILALGLLFTSIDTICSVRGRVLLREFPLLVALMEALFIGLLCFYHTGLDSPFRFYYLLSLICCAIRYSPGTTFATCGFDCLSYTVLWATTQNTTDSLSLYLLTLVILVWVTLAAGALARLLKRNSAQLQLLNAQLQENQVMLETRIAERTRELEATQAQVLHQEKMAAFGLLAAGIAHEVGNPLTSISNVIQMLERREPDNYTQEKLGLVTGQLARIQGTLRELLTFSRPASDQHGSVNLSEVVQEALCFAKYYRGGTNRKLEAHLDPDLPKIPGVRDQLVQVVFNLLLNAMDATGKGGCITITARLEADAIYLGVRDDGHGVTPETRAALFRPYFTTKPHGTGLGLFVVQQIVAKHRGRIDVESAVGCGATFTIRFPLNVGQAETYYAA